MSNLITIKLVSGVLVVTIVTLIFFVGCSKSTPKTNIKEGDYYVVQRDEKPGYKVLKILKVDENGYHIRLYSNVFQQIPQMIEIDSLVMVGFDQEDELHDAGMGHLPISNQGFENWGVVFIQNGTVDTSELEGYEMWKEAKGGYF